VGPLTRAATWESVAIPDLREQAHTLAMTVAADLSVEAGPLFATARS
jgi:uncharacterized NAD(P)/FAD-binding protein YdhS